MRPPAISTCQSRSWCGSWRRIGPPAAWPPKPEGGWRYSKLDPHRDFLIRRVAEKGDITMPQLAAELLAWARRSRPRRSRAGSSARATASKKTLRASEQERSDVRQAREHWRTKRQPRMRQEPHRLVFLDETGTSTKMTRLRGRCLEGQRLYAKAPFGHWLTQTFIAGLRCYGLTAPWVIDGPMTRQIFETYVETQLAPPCRKATWSSSTTCRRTRVRRPHSV